MKQMDRFCERRELGAPNSIGSLAFPKLLALRSESAVDEGCDSLTSGNSMANCK